MQNDAQGDDWGIPLASHDENKRVIRTIAGAGLLAFGLVAAELVMSLNIV